MSLRDMDSTLLGVVVDDRDPQAVFDSMLALAESRLPTWEPRNGALETVIMEACAVGVADTIYAANRVLGALVEAVINIYGVQRFEGAEATGTVRMSLAGGTLVRVETGTQFRLESVDAMLLATEPVETTGTTLDVPVASLDTGGYLNDVPAGALVDPLIGVPSLVGCVLHTALSGGVDAESDLAFLNRAAARFARVTSSLVLPAHFTAFALEQPWVRRTNTVDLWNPDAGSGVPGDHPGHVGVYVYGVGAALDASQLAELQASMSAQAASILDVHVKHAVPVSMPVSVQVTPAAGFDQAELSAAIADALASVWSWQSSGFGADVDPLDVQAVVENVPGVDAVTALSAPASALTVDFDEFAVLGAVTVTWTP